MRIPRFIGCTLAALVLSQPAEAVQVLWIVGGKPTRQAVEILERLRQADEYGLTPQSYELGLAEPQLRLVIAGAADPQLQAGFEAALSREVTQFAHDLHQGRVSAAAAGFDLPAAAARFDAEAAARQIAGARDVASTIATIEPRPAPYRALRSALTRYRELARRPDLHRLPPLPRRSITIGDTFAGAAALRDLLMALGDLNASDVPQHGGEQIDAALRDAVRRFQTRHRLSADGVIGPRTYQAMTTPLAHRVLQIELTLERWRWLSQLARPDVAINIPHFMLYALPRPEYGERDVIEMPVIVGRTHTRTPVFAAAIEQVIFHPFWDVPASIVRNEILPQVRKDPSYLARHHFEIVRGQSDNASVVAPDTAAIAALATGRLRLRQRPGPDNALGPVKFVLPNPYDVRVHGTPERGLFAHTTRAFSHGCIRVSDPAKLAEYVLKNARGTWNAEAIEAALCETQTVRVSLTTAVRVIVFYATAATSDRLGVLFSEDIYGHDRQLARLLQRRASASLGASVDH